MTRTFKSFALITTLGTLAACGGGGTGGDGGPVVDEPTAPNISETTVRNAAAFINRVDNRRDTPDVAFLPTGTATYTGEMIVGMTLNGVDSVDGMIGDVRLTAELFSAGDEVSGTITNIHTLNGDDPVELLSGQLAFNGELDDVTKEMTSTLSGQLNGVLGDGERGDLNISGSMTGHTQDTEIVTTIPNPLPFQPPIEITTYDVATGIYGRASGGITGSESGSFSGTWAVSE